MSRRRNQGQKNTGQSEKEFCGTDMEKLINLYGDELLKLCFLYLHDLQLAEDAVQETYIRIFQNYDRFLGKSAEKTWITRIAINVCKDYLRSPWKQKVFYGGIEPEYGKEAETMEPEIRDDIVIRAICGLKPKYREVVLLFYYQELKTSEIAEILGISVSAVTVRLTRAREQLREKLKGWYFDE